MTLKHDILIWNAPTYIKKINSTFLVCKMIIIFITYGVTFQEMTALILGYKNKGVNKLIFNVVLILELQGGD